MSSLKLSNFVSISDEMTSYLNIFNLPTRKKVTSDFLPNAYAGELLERYVEQDVINNNEERLEVLMVSTIPMFIRNKEFTIYGTQLVDGLNNFKETSEKFPKNYLMKLVVNLYETYVDKKSLYIEDDENIIALMKKLTANQISLLVEALSIFEISGKYDEPITKNPNDIAYGIGGMYLNLLEALDLDKYKELKQSSRLSIVLWAGINKKLFKLVKKDFKKNTFYEEITKVSNDLLRDKGIVANEFLTKIEAAIITYLGVYRDILVNNSSTNSSNSIHRISNYFTDINLFVDENDFFCNFYRDSLSNTVVVKEFNEELIHKFVYKMNNSNDYEQSGCLNLNHLRDLKISPENDEELNKIANYFKELTNKFISEVPLDKLKKSMEREIDEVLVLNETQFIQLFEFIYRNELFKADVFDNETITNQLDYINHVFDLKKTTYYNSFSREIYSVKNVKYLYEQDIITLDKKNILLKNKEILNVFFDYVSLNLNEFFYDKYEIFKENFLVKYYLSSSSDISKVINFIEKLTKEEVNMYINDYLDVIYKYKALKFVNTLENLYFEIYKNYKDTEVFEDLLKELYDSLSHIKQENETLISEENRKYFAVTDKDIINYIDEIYISKYSSENPIDVIENKLKKLFSLEEIHRETVQQFLYGKIYQSIFKELINSDKITITDIAKYCKYYDKLKTKDILLDVYVKKFDGYYEEMISKPEVLRHINIYQDIIKVYENVKNNQQVTL